MNPLVPTFADGAVTAVALAATIFTLVALVSWLRNSRMLGLHQFGWLAAIVLVPILGPAAWFAVGRPSQVATAGLDSEGKPAN
jgi:hypothetical protein